MANCQPTGLHRARAPEGERTVAEFIYVVRPPRPTFVADATQEEANVVAAHLAYLHELRAEGRLLLAGRTDGGEFGIVVFLAEDAEHADQTVHADPAVYQGVFTADCYPFRLALLPIHD